MTCFHHSAIILTNSAGLCAKLNKQHVYRVQPLTLTLQI